MNLCITTNPIAQRRREARHLQRIDHIKTLDATPTGPLRYGPSSQQPRRQCERAVRRSALALTRLALRHGCTLATVAVAMGINPRTLKEWRQRWAADHLDAHARGRPAERSPAHLRNQLIHVMHRQGEHVGVRHYLDMELFKGMTRREIEDLVRRYKNSYQRYERIRQSLRWTTPGTVWAMDHTTPPTLIDGVHPSVLSVRDLASGAQLAWQPLPQQNAEFTVAVLESLFIVYGAPLVIKSDNGSPFISEEMKTLLDAWGVVLMLSPPRTPRYNGACESGIRWMKTRTNHFAALRTGRAGQPGNASWTTPDMQAALRQANHGLSPSDASPHRVFKDRTPITQANRHAFADTLMHVRKVSTPEHHEQPDGSAQRYTRSNVEQALVQSHLLVITRRSIPQLLKSFFRTRIT